jgi:hypothetical protein
MTATIYQFGGNPKPRTQQSHPAVILVLPERVHPFDYSVDDAIKDMEDWSRAIAEAFGIPRSMLYPRLWNL